MGEKSAIEWTDATWTPIRGVGTDRWLCQKVSPGCDHCYASSLNQSRIFNPQTLGAASAYPEAGPLAIGTGVGAPGDRPVVLDERILEQPLHWAKPRKVFVCSMTDLFGEWVPDAWLDRVFEVMAEAERHTFQVLTKRAKRMRDYMTGRFRGRTHGNIWLGVTVESQEYAWRLNYLKQTPAAVRFVSAEPLLGPLDLSNYVYVPHTEIGDFWLHWVITGGESGPEHRPFSPEWAEAVREQCDQAGVPFLHKQNGGRTSKSKGRELFGKVYDGYPQRQAA